MAIRMLKINQMQNGSCGRQVFFVSSTSLAKTKKGKDYYNVTLRDSTGVLPAKIWSLEGLNVNISATDYVLATYQISEWEGQLQGSLTEIVSAPQGSYTESDFFPVSKLSIEDMFSDLQKYLDLVKDPEFAALNNRFLRSAEWCALIRKHSAAVSVHHAFVGGWLQHTLSVIKLCYAEYKQYPALSLDLLITAAFLHDIGKVRELTAFPQNQYSDEGYLFGHIFSGTQIIQKEVAHLDNFSSDKLAALLHCVLAHHGQLAFGSPVKPVLAEALALAMADNTDAKLEIFFEATEPLTPEERWSSYNRYLETRVGLTIL